MLLSKIGNIKIEETENNFLFFSIHFSSDKRLVTYLD